MKSVTLLAITEPPKVQVPSPAQVVSSTQMVTPRVVTHSPPGAGDNPHASFPHQALRVCSIVQLVMGIIFCILGLIDAGVVAASYPGWGTTRRSKIGCSLYQLWCGLPFIAAGVTGQFVLPIRGERMSLWITISMVVSTLNACIFGPALFIMGCFETDEVNRDSKTGVYYWTRLFDDQDETYYNAHQKGIPIVTFLLAIAATIVAVLTASIPCCCTHSKYGTELQTTVTTQSQPTIVVTQTRSLMGCNMQRAQFMVGQPMAGQPMMGQPMTGQYVAGQPMAGQRMAGQPMAGQPMMGQPMAGQEGYNIQPGHVFNPSVPVSAPPYSASEQDYDAPPSYTFQ